MMFKVLVKLFHCLVFNGLSPSLIVTVTPLGFTWCIIKVKCAYISKNFIKCLYFNTKVQVLINDNDTKYMDGTSQSNLVDYGIVH
jgi:hypothetical protein